MFEKCPFFPEDINPCEIHHCRFLCNGGCAIQLSAYSHDAFQESKKANEKIDDIKNRLSDLENQIRQLRR